ncbi:glycoside hydrolase family 132 protein [Xylaria sp. CBS 124048]|nr:glycoside hydrolase family 132 protein [Xylaria sp. CBS 124048]
MKQTVLNLALAASVGSAVAQPHHGRHMHQKRDDAPPAKRDVETTYVSAMVTEYVLGTQNVSPGDAQAGLDKGLYVVVGETTPTFTPPPAPVPTTTASAKLDAIFIEKTSQTSTSTSISTSSTSTSTPPPATSSAPAPQAPAPAAPEAPSSSGGTGLDADFPDGELDCSTFPSDYGALALDYLGLGGWSGLQYTPNFSLKDLAVSFIETGTAQPSGQLGFYSYACPMGYVKTQWPSAQGNTGQSVGGLMCNQDGKLELTRSDVTKKLCEPGIPGITIKNEMSSGASVCRTDYPGTENMVIPLDATPGGTFELANVASSSYYVWEGKSTTLQYYVNKKGVSAEEGCRWTCASDPTGCGNWAPVNIGVGQSSDGTTYLSIFPNSAVSQAVLDFNIDISGDNTIPCSYHVGEGFAGGSSGCTTGIPNGGKVTITFSE